MRMNALLAHQMLDPGRDDRRGRRRGRRRERPRTIQRAVFLAAAADALEENIGMVDSMK